MRTIIKLVLLVALSGMSLLTGCALIEDIVEPARDLNDAKMDMSHLLYCDANTTGALAREFGNNKEQWNSWWLHCYPSLKVPPLPTEREMNMNRILNRAILREASNEGDEGGSGDGGSTTTTWRDGLPSDLQGSPALKDVADVNSLAKQFVDAQRMIGNSIRIPGEDAGEDDKRTFYDTLAAKVPNLMPTPDYEDADAMNTVYKTLGRPDEVTGYEMPQVEGVPIDEERTSFLAGLAHENGLSNRQFKGIMSKILDKDSEQISAYQKSILDGHTSLKQEWGQAYEARVAAVVNTAKNGGAPDELVSAMEKGEMRAESVKWLYGLMEGGKEAPNFNNRDEQLGNTVGEAEQKIADIMNNPKHAYWNPGDPGNQSAINKVVALQRQIVDAKSRV